MNHRQYHKNKDVSLVLGVVVIGFIAVIGGYFIGNILLNVAGGRDISHVNTEPRMNEFVISDYQITTPEVTNLPEERYVPEAQSGSLYVVQLGAFNSRANAERLKDELLEKGYPSVIITEGPPYKVQLRASQNRDDAESLKNEIKKDGYVDVFIVH